ncbi:MAG: glycosyltransferase [Acidimicrobiales bacterium]
MQALIAGITLYCIAIGLVQLTFLLTLGWLESRRIRREGDQALRAAAEELARTGTYVPPDQWQPQAVFAIVPCLDEALVIDPTVRALVASSPLTRVVVVDDASDDGTREAALACGDPRVTVLRRELPEARLGKGPALNHAFAWICEQVAAEALDPDRVLVLVMDADGRLSEGAIAKVASLFADPRVGGAQLGVRIRNRADNVLATIQDIEFWGIAALGQLGRIRTATVSLGGNGQFARFAALRSVGDAPWSPALTEDLDLAITLSIQGWHLTSHSECWVSQQGLTEVRPLIKQRTRWFQGHMTTAVTRLGELWRSPHLSNTSVLEVTSYLLIPFIIVLPWSVLSQIGFATSIGQLLDHGVPTGATGLPGPSWLLPVLLWYLLSFLPTIICGLVYAQRQRDVPWWRAVLLSHLLVAWNYVLFIACWRGLWRMVRGQTGWVKTHRVVEAPAPSPGEGARPALAAAAGAGGPRTVSPPGR